MPLLEFQCADGHVTEKLFRTFAAADGITLIECPLDQCFLMARLIPSTPFPAHFLGNPDGYHKPSPTKRFSNKLVSQKDGNKNSIG